jgi:uncharacterized protein YqgC (DUF456 family)
MPTDPRFWSEVVLQALTLFALLVGWLGLFVPVFPGLVVMWLATAVYAALENLAGRMAAIDWVLFGLISLLTVIGNIVDNVIIARKMRGRSIPWSSILLAYLAAIVFSAFFTPVAGIAAAPLTLFAVESARLHNRGKGFESARAYMIAWGWSFLAVFGIGALMIGVWVAWAFF